MRRAGGDADAGSPFPATSDPIPVSPPASACTFTLPFAIDAFFVVVAVVVVGQVAQCAMMLQMQQ